MGSLPNIFSIEIGLNEFTEDFPDDISSTEGIFKTGMFKSGREFNRIFILFVFKEGIAINNCSKFLENFLIFFGFFIGIPFINLPCIISESSKKYRTLNLLSNFKEANN